MAWAATAARRRTALRPTARRLHRRQCRQSLAAGNARPYARPCRRGASTGTWGSGTLRCRKSRHTARDRRAARALAAACAAAHCSGATRMACARIPSCRSRRTARPSARDGTQSHSGGHSGALVRQGGAPARHHLPVELLIGVDAERHARPQVDVRAVVLGAALGLEWHVGHVKRRRPARIGCQPWSSAMSGHQRRSAGRQISWPPAALSDPQCPSWHSPLALPHRLAARLAEGLE